MAGANWVLGQGRFLSRREVSRLLKTAQARAKAAIARGRKVPVRDYFIVDLALSTGLRVMEIAQLNCGDVHLAEGGSCVLVRRGKGGRSRSVAFNDTFRQHCRQYLSWKGTQAEPTGPEDPLLLSSNTGMHLTRRAIQKAFRRCAAAAGLSNRYSIHSLRHTYACHLYKAAGYNLRLVQKQLGHARVTTTQVYADVMEPDLQKCKGRSKTVARGGRKP